MTTKRDFTRLFFGPQHPGITGNMGLVLDVKGDEIIRAETHVGYLHRGFEKLVERRNFMQAFTIVCRICVPEPDVNEENFARAVEELAEIEVPERAKYIRTMVLELARLVAYFQWMGGQAGSMGLYTAPQWAIGDRDHILDLFEELSGGRVYHMYIIPGGVRRDLPPNFKEKVLDTLDYLENRLPEYDNLIFENAVFKKRSIGIGVIDKDKALEWGVTGPMLRGCGYAYDVRRDDPYEAYDKVEFDVITAEGGDVYARAMVRRREIEQSIRIIRQVLEMMPSGKVRVNLGNPHSFKVKKGKTYVKVESARGEYGYFFVTDGTQFPRRMQVRGPSYIHAVSLLENMLVGANIADVPVILTSLGTCPPEIER